MRCTKTKAATTATVNAFSPQEAARGSYVMYEDIYCIEMYGDIHCTEIEFHVAAVVVVVAVEAVVRVVAVAHVIAELRRPEGPPSRAP